MCGVFFFLFKVIYALSITESHLLMQIQFVRYIIDQITPLAAHDQLCCYEDKIFFFRQQGSQLLRGGLKKLRNDLNLPLEGDLRIVMATAEKLKPGFCQVLLGERRYDTEYLPNVPDLF